MELRKCAMGYLWRFQLVLLWGCCDLGSPACKPVCLMPVEQRMTPRDGKNGQAHVNIALAKKRQL
eukprot:1239249-Amphidinium_carterae.1